LTDIFVSYASENRAWVERLVRVLEQQGFGLWWDRELIAGHQFDERASYVIARGLGSLAISKHVFRS